MVETRSWQEMQAWVADMLEARTGAGVAEWSRRIEAAGPFEDENSLRAWLDREDVHGYPQGMLVMEQFGYPDFLVASPDQLVEAQYADRPALRPIYDAIIARLPEVGADIAVQTRKTYVSLVAPKRTFAVAQATTRTRVDLGLRLQVAAEGRLIPATRIGNGAMPVRIALTSADEVDDEVVDLMARSYRENS